MARSLVVNIVGDASSLERALKKSQKSVNTFGRSVERSNAKAGRSFAGLGRSMVGLGAGVGVTAAIKSSIEAASDLEQQIGKTNVVFGRSGKEVEAWSKTLADSFGLSQREALTTASTLGALFAPIGLTGDAAAKQSQRLTELGADLASFYNTDVASALDALRSGLVGESEPLRKYGVLLSETRVQQEALNQSGKRSASQLTSQEKVLARISLIFKDSKVAQGDFARTSDELAQKTKIAKANIEDLKVELADGLVPALADATGWATDFFREMNQKPVLGRGLWQNMQDLRAHFLGDRARRNPLFGTKGFHTEPLKLTKAFEVAANAIDKARAAVLGGGAARAGGGDGLTKAQREGQRARIRQAAEAARQAVLDRAEFNVEKTGATKTLKDDLAALNRYNALLSKRIRGGHGTLELEREQFRVQQQIADVIKQQADLAKRTRKRLGVDVTRFQATARGQLVLAGASSGPRGIHIANLNLVGIRNASQLENELARRSKQRARQRRAR